MCLLERVFDFNCVRVWASVSEDEEWGLGFGYVSSQPLPKIKLFDFPLSIYAVFCEGLTPSTVQARRQHILFANP